MWVSLYHLYRKSTNLWPLSAMGGVLVGAPTRTVTPGDRSHCQGLRRANQGFKVMYLHPMSVLDDATADIHSVI
jgi:hypothetical protein